MLIKGTLSPGVGLLRPLLSHRRMSFAAFKAPMQTGWHAKDTKKGYKTRRYSEGTWWIGHQRIQAAAHFLSVGGTSSWIVLEQVGHPGKQPTA